MTLSLQPLSGRVFIRPEQTVPAETFLHIPEAYKNRDMPDRGTVFAIGGRRITKKGVVLDHEFKVGDRVQFKKHSGLWVDVRGHKLIQVSGQDILAVI